MELRGVWASSQATRENADVNLSLLRQSFPWLVVATNDDVYRVGGSSRHFPVGHNQEPGFLGGILPETLDKYEHHYVGAEFTPLVKLVTDAGAGSILVKVGRAAHDDFLDGLVGFPFPVYYSFLLSERETHLVEIASVLQASFDGRDFLTRILTVVDVVYSTREDEFSLFTRDEEITQMFASGRAGGSKGACETQPS